ncbi:DUF485 domain-containing protein [Bacillus benzoevorans]|uniref:Uncharacterized membrane protein (DUF485 family) n=1 Tax=Bacillus benzoevorans TaxID=1456 RepID=A0A7X0HML5_9BACI|nr:DUF485 domain-containing protein [Bacillus benzoevorans]MBB6443603.1 uncharacterized membrane protein (DUF485 family) [Bacillus benzoevorans]
MAQQNQLLEGSAQRKNNEADIPFEELVQTEEFKGLLKRKKTFIIPTTIFFLVFYFTMPLLAAYTNVLHSEVIGPISGAWVYAGLQFLLVWICGFIYVKKSEKLDNLSKEILNKFRKELR